MKFSNLKESPQFLAKTIKLIEESFEYEKQNSFEVDFYPLINEKNLSHCHILLEEETVIAHIGAQIRTINLENQKYPITMYGGISVDKDHQAQGHFTKLFQHVLRQYSSSCLHLLWSEKLELYQKFNFHPAIELNQYPYHKSDELPSDEFKVEQSYLIDLDSKTLEQVKKLYLNSTELRLNREKNDWENLIHITSAQLYLIYKNDELHNFFIKNKGQDLTDIIHEYGFIDNEQKKIMCSYGTLWSSLDLKSEAKLFAALVSIGDKEKFKAFIHEYIDFRITQIDKDVSFIYKDENFLLSTKEFLQGVFGPGRFAEISAPPLFISGLDSI